MGAFEKYLYSGEYKQWKDAIVYVNPFDSNDVIYSYGKIKPRPGSKIKPFATIVLQVIDDVGFMGGNRNWTFYLYDFEKKGEVVKKIVRHSRNRKAVGNKFYDDSLEEVLGGYNQTLGE